MKQTLTALALAASFAVLFATAPALSRPAFAQDGHEGHGHESEAAPGTDDHEGHAHAEEADAADPHDVDAHAADPHAGHAEEGHIVLTPEEIVEFGIETAVAEPGLVEEFVYLPGEVHPNDDRLAHIVPRYSGIVTEVRAKLGDRVQKGDVLAVVESDEALAPYEIRTLIDGTVIEKHITLGEAASRERATFVIADLSTVWIDLTVYQRDIDRVRTGQTAFILTGHEPPDASGTISYVTPVMDEQTRTATARVVLPNDGRWLPGMFITGRVQVDAHRAPVAVPPAAIHRIDDRPVVFLRDGDGFRVREVVLGPRGVDRVEIAGGLAPGATYVVAGGFTLKAELEKGSFGDGHAH